MTEIPLLIPFSPPSTLSIKPELNEDISLGTDLQTKKLQMKRQEIPPEDNSDEHNTSLEKEAGEEEEEEENGSAFELSESSSMTEAEEEEEEEEENYFVTEMDKSYNGYEDYSTIKYQGQSTFYFEGCHKKIKNHLCKFHFNIFVGL